MPEKNPINLYQKNPLEKQAPKRKFTLWLSSFGKAIILATNLVTIGAFIFRVKIDQTKLDLEEKISVQERVVLASSGFESDFRDFQNKITILKNASAKPSLTTNLDLVAENIPGEIVLKTSEITANKVNLNMESETGGALSIMAANLLKNGAKDIALTEAHFGTAEQGYEFTIEVEL